MSKRIVDGIIEDLLFHPDNTDSIFKARALSFFKLCDLSDIELNSGEEYSVIVKTRRDFLLSLEPSRLVLHLG